MLSILLCLRRLCSLNAISLLSLSVSLGKKLRGGLCCRRRNICVYGRCVVMAFSVLFQTVAPSPLAPASPGTPCDGVVPSSSNTSAHTPHQLLFWGRWKSLKQCSITSKSAAHLNRPMLSHSSDPTVCCTPFPPACCGPRCSLRQLPCLTFPPLSGSFTSRYICVLCKPKIDGYNICPR